MTRPGVALAGAVLALGIAVTTTSARAQPSPASSTAPATAVAPALFAPGVISSEFSETSAAFTPDGKTVYFTRSDAYELDNTIMVSDRIGAQWSEPRVAPFSGEWRDSEPHVAPDGTRLFFVSNRPASPGAAPLVVTAGRTPSPGANLWYVERCGTGWGPPVRVDGPVNAGVQVYNPSVTRDGTLYFSGVLAGDTANQIYRARLVRGRYQVPERLPFNDPRWHTMDPTVSPDDRFLVFAWNRPGTLGSADLFLTFHHPDGTWTEPASLGAEVNTPGLENAPVLGPDGTTLYYSSTRTRTAGKFPKPREDASQVSARLHSTENGLRNLWFVDLRPWLARAPALSTGGRRP